MADNTKSTLIKTGAIVGAVLATGITIATTVSINTARAAEEAAELARLQELAELAEIRALLDNPNIYDNIYIENIDMSNVSVDNAKNMILEKMSKPGIVLTYNEREFIITAEEMGLTYGVDDAVNHAVSLGRDGNDDFRLKTLASFEETNINIDIDISYDEEAIRDRLNQIAKEIYVPVVEPTITKSGSTFSIVSSGSNGVSMNVEDAFENIMQVIEEPAESIIAVVTNVLTPKTTAESVSKMGDVLGTFTTNFSNTASSADRNTNMRLAAGNINGTVVNVGEVFSTNKEFGPTTKENGFKLGGSFLNGELVQSYGGGVCQVSSTLYMAVLHSELEIVERQNHSMPVGYIGYGYDATLAGDYIDLKFKNNTNAPIYVESYLSSTNQVVCTIYGYDERSSSRSIKFENTLSATSSTGFTYKVYKLIYENNQLVDKIHINNSYYKSTGGGTATTAAVVVNLMEESPTEATTQAVTEVPITTTQVVDTPVTIALEEQQPISTYHSEQSTTAVITEAPITTTQVTTQPITEPTTQLTTAIPEVPDVSETQTQVITEATTETTTQVITETPITTTTQVTTEVTTQATTQAPAISDVDTTLEEEEEVI